ncbi:hypothetical protein GMDG_00873 [Pseudogymnoascus destructans 20631-21]|uniref:Chromo domain-containing protein n=2 Tax=Pseudogymnoascus destructans TaxID=655981 RepID=L8FMS1_PSED2|nr:hypothetical protein GMDG_00873 [Pseudogymnoascus destructans 20631-21]
MAEPSTPRHTPSPSKIRTSETHSLRDRSAQPFYGRQRQRSQKVFPHQSASPAKSRRSTTAPRQPTRSSSRSRNATPSGGVQKGWKSAPPKPNTSTPQKRSKSTTSTPSKPKPAPPTAESADDANGNKNDTTESKQWKVTRLLDDKWEMKTRRRCHYYLTQWAGGYEPTWERSTNITSDLKAEYETWMKTPEGKAHKERKEAVEKSARAEIDRDVVMAPGIQDQSQNSSRITSVDDQVQVSKRLGAHTGDIFAPDDNTNGVDSPDPLAAGMPTTVKREQSEESMDELRPARSPFSPPLSQAAANAVESDAE